MFRNIFLLFMSISFLTVYASNYIERDGSKYLPDRIVIKFKNNQYGQASSVSLSKKSLERFDAFGAQGFESMFNAKLKGSDELNGIQVVKINSPVDVRYASEKLSKLPEVEWAEPYYIYDLALTPNDPQYAGQYALTKIQASAAWDISTGSPDVIIAIVDTGIDWDHPDLADNIWINEAEANGTEGVDDDNNGYIDDIRGWDFGGVNGTPDADPREDRPDHGTHVAGIASAVTNNGIGVASIGYNCKLMAVKTSQDNVRDEYSNALISYGYEGIIYAVENGASVINCSWGSYSYSNVFQSVINYVVANGVLLVGAAGNENNRDAIYPGNYKGALSVGYSNSQDKRDPSSNYGERVDIFAPGSSIYGTWQNDSYAYLNGSSMASPLVAGIAGLMYSKFPEYSPLQIAEQIRVNADNIDSNNPGYEYLLGSGRANAYKALSNINSKSVRLNEAKFYDRGDGDGVFESGEIVDVEVHLTNYLDPLSGLSVSLVTESPYIQVDKSTVSFGSQPTLAEFNNEGNLFRFKIGEATPLNRELSLRLEFNDGNYSDFQWTETIIINPLFKTTSKNDIQLTITSKGTIAYNDYPDNLQGSGFKFEEGPDILFEGGLLYGNSAERMVSAVRDESGETQSDEFSIQQPFVMQSPGDVADEQGYAIFNDDNAGIRRFNIETELHSYTFADDESADFVILKYIFNNNSTNNYTDFYAGMFFDWDIDAESSSENLVKYTVSGDFGYAYNSDLEHIDTHAGVVVLTDDDPAFYAIDNVEEVYDGFSDAEKWRSLTNRRNYSTVGPTDASFVTGTGPYTLQSGGKLEVAFALIAGHSLDELKDAADRSREKYSYILTDINEEGLQPIEYALEQNYPNPFNPSTTINYSIPEAGFVTIKVYDILGAEVATLVNKEQTAGKHNIEFDATNLPSGLYLYRMQSKSFNASGKMLLIK